MDINSRGRIQTNTKRSLTLLALSFLATLLVLPVNTAQAVVEESTSNVEAVSTFGTEETQVASSDLPVLLTVQPQITEPAYVRAKFEHWIDADGDFCNTRYEVLIEESLTPVSIEDRCKISGGHWVSPYDNFETHDHAEIEVDHVVALAEAWKSGAWAWTDAERRDFANDLEVPYVLTASSSPANQAKADKDPAKWLPNNQDYVCEYITNWTLIKYRWQLTADAAEHAVIEQHLSGDACPVVQVSLPQVMSVTIPGGSVDTEPEIPDDTVYETMIHPLSSGLTRLSGKDRYLTAVEVSKRFSPNVPVAFVATGTDFPDALSAAAAASTLGGPLLLTMPKSLPGAVADELKRLNPKQIYVVGGTGAVSNSVFGQLQQISPVTRLSGANRYATGERIVSETFEGQGSSTAFIATGRGFADALAATGAAGSIDAPVILVDGTQKTVPTSTRNLLASLGTTNVVFVGGKGAVSTGIESQLKAAGFLVKRYGGSDRYATAALINEPYFSSGSTSTVFLATGSSFPDALAGAALAGQIGAPLYVSDQACTPEPIYQAIKNLSPTSRVAMGGTSVISNNAANNNRCKPKPFHDKIVTAGPFCGKDYRGYYAISTKDALVRCSVTDADPHLRWRLVALHN